MPMPRGFIMAVLVIASQKGGVGKTGFAISITQYLSEFLEKRCLYVPLDNQGGSANRAFNLKSNHKVLNGMFFNEEYDIQTVSEYIDSLSSNRTIHQLDRTDLEEAMIFANEIRSLSKKYDHIIIDTPPGLGARITAAILAADKIIIPVECEASAVEGMMELKDTIRKLNRFNPKAKMNALVINKYTGTSEQREIFEFLAAKFEKEIIDIPLRDLQPIKTATTAGRPVWQQKKNGNERVAGKLVKSVISRIFEKVL